MTTPRQEVHSLGVGTFLMFSMGRLVELINAVSAAMDTRLLEEVALVFEVNSQAMRCCAICARIVVDMSEGPIDRDHLRARLDRLFEALTTASAVFPTVLPAGAVGAALAELQHALRNMREALTHLHSEDEGVPGA